MKANNRHLFLKQLTIRFFYFIILVTAFSISSFAQTNYSFKVDISGNGKPVLLIPGLISSGEVWNETVLTLSENYECHVLTMPGFAGVPPQTDAPYIETWKDEIERYIQEQNLDRVTLVGHSLGGFLSIWIASDNLPQLKQIIVVDALPFLAGTMNPNAVTGFNEANAKQYMSSLSGMDVDQLKNTRMMMARGMTNDSTRWEILTEWTLNSDLKTEAYSATEMMGIDLREDIANITVPVLAIGAFDENPQFPGFTREQMEQTYLSQYQNIKNLQFEVADGAKHFIMYDKPEWMVETMKDFMKKNQFNQQ
ncbi:alpha/beta fold hydrolase [Rhodohalobacter halophilus]|uniref:alpha/beta fold hydrolase n=1 Tax=Rhodohalobacter halophilus TaxID=1812810 RepID=UPI00083FCF05|nr:alpha/beta hydrolase [Rhodohalobacter halophilus]